MITLGNLIILALLDLSTSRVRELSCLLCGTAHNLRDSDKRNPEHVVQNERHPFLGRKGLKHNEQEHI